MYHVCLPIFINFAWPLMLLTFSSLFGEAESIILPGSHIFSHLIPCSLAHGTSITCPSPSIPLVPTLWNSPAFSAPGPATYWLLSGLTSALANQAVCGPHCRLSCRQALGRVNCPPWQEGPVQLSSVHKITANKLQITKDTFIIDLFRPLELLLPFV